MKALLMGCGALVLLAVLAVGGCSLLVWRSFKTMPEDAKRESLFPANRTLIERIDGIIAEAEDVHVLAQRLREAISDERVLYLRLSDESSQWQEDAIKRVSWESASSSTWNGAGWGTLKTKFDSREIRIIDSRQRTRNGVDVRYLLYLAHEPTVEREK